jgi:hypothetical protein
MKYAWQVILLVAFAAVVPFIVSGCCLKLSGK